MTYREIDLLITQHYKRDAQVSMQIYEAVQIAGCQKESEIRKFLNNKKKIFQANSEPKQPNGILQELNKAEGLS